MVEFPEKIWAIEKGHPSRYRVSCSVLEHGPDEATEYVRADLYAALEAQLAAVQDKAKQAAAMCEAGYGVGAYNVATSILSALEPAATCKESLQVEPAAPEGQQPVTEAMVEALKRIRDTAMKHTITARIPECGVFGCIAQDADWLMREITAAQEEGR